MWKWEAEGQPKAVVVIIHNVYEHHRRYAWLIQRLRNSQFHVVMGDLPGHGEAAAVHEHVHNEKITSYDEYVRKIMQVALEESLPLFIIGHGFGATLVIKYLLEEKIECAGVILSSPWLQLAYQPAKYINVLAKLSSTMQIDHYIEPHMLTENDEIIEEMHRDEATHSRVTTQWYRELQSYFKSVEQSERLLPNIPLLLHIAGQDTITAKQHAKSWLLKQQLSEFQYKKWEKLYHDLHLEREREDVFLYTQSFMHNILRSLGYIISESE